MRWALFATAMAASITAGAGAAALDLRPPHIDVTMSQHDQQICEPIKFNVYFEQGQTRLSEPAERMLDMVGSHVRGCTVASVGIDTPAADVASADGRHIAGLRGAVLVKALHARGVNAQAFVISQSGSPNEPASAAPPHVSVAIDAAKPSLSVERLPSGKDV